MGDAYSGPGELVFNGVRVAAMDLAVDFADAASEATGVTGFVRDAAGTIEVTASATIPVAWGEPAPFTLTALRAAYDALPRVAIPDLLIVHPRAAAALRWHFDRVVPREARGEYVPADETHPPVTAADLLARRDAYRAADGPALPWGPA